MQIQSSDRSFQYGDAVFSTIRIFSGQPQLWSFHWCRLRLSMQRLGFVIPDEQQVHAKVMAVISEAEQVVKVLISRGQSSRGYGTVGIVQPQVYCWAAPLPDYSQIRQYGVRLGLASLQFSRQPLLAGMKHCSRLETVLLKREAEQSGYDDLVAADTEGLVIEATASNLLVWQQQRWRTPVLSHAGVAGVMRQFALEQKLVEEQPLPVAEFSGIQSMALCNALIGVVPVASFQGRALDIAPALVLQRQIKDLLQDR